MHVAGGKEMMVGGEFKDGGVEPYTLRKEIWTVSSILGKAIGALEQ